MEHDGRPKSILLKRDPPGKSSKKRAQRDVSVGKAAISTRAEIARELIGLEREIEKAAERLRKLTQARQRLERKLEEGE